MFKKNVATWLLLVLAGWTGIVNAALIYTSPATNGSGNFTTFDTATGTETVLGTTFGNMGLSFDSNNNLFGVKQSGLYSVNLSNGATTLIGNNTISTFVEAATFALDGRLIAGTSGSGQLYEINTATGVETLLGAVTGGLTDFDGLTVAPSAVNTILGLLPAGTLFAADSGSVWAIDLNTLTSTLLFSGVNANETLAFDANGTLYGNSSGWSEINLLTGAGTSLGGSSVWGSAVFGALSNGNQVPEPGTIALFGLGLLGLGFARRKKA